MAQRNTFREDEELEEQYRKLEDLTDLIAADIAAEE